MSISAMPLTVQESRRSTVSALGTGPNPNPNMSQVGGTFRATTGASEAVEFGRTMTAPQQSVLGRTQSFEAAQGGSFQTVPMGASTATPQAPRGGGDYAPAGAACMPLQGVTCVPPEALHGALLRDPVPGIGHLSMQPGASGGTRGIGGAPGECGPENDPCGLYGGSQGAKPSRLATQNSQAISELQKELQGKMDEIERANKAREMALQPEEEEEEPQEPRMLSGNERRIMEIQQQLQMAAERQRQIAQQQFAQQHPPQGGPAPYASRGMDAGGYGGGNPGFDPFAVAAALYHACKGFGTNEDAVWGALGSVRSQADWQAVIDAFQQQHGDMKGGDLRRALESDLTRSELDRAKGILAQNGVQWDGGYGAATSPPGGYAPAGAGGVAGYPGGSAPGSSSFGSRGVGSRHNPAMQGRPQTEFERWDELRTKGHANGITPEELGFQTAVERKSKEASYGRADFKPVYSHSSPGRGEHRTMSNQQQIDAGFGQAAPLGSPAY